MPLVSASLPACPDSFAGEGKLCTAVDMAACENSYIAVPGGIYIKCFIGGANCVTGGPICKKQLSGCQDWITGDNGNTKLDVAYWTKKCQEVPAQASYLKMEMYHAKSGKQFTDYYRPISGKTFCDMLKTVNPDYHEWSNDAQSWERPAYDTGSHHLGGSEWNWAKALAQGRTTTSVWGSTIKEGGCCSNTNNQWNVPYTMQYCF